MVSSPRLRVYKNDNGFVNIRLDALRFLFFIYFFITKWYRLLFGFGRVLDVCFSVGFALYWNLFALFNNIKKKILIKCTNLFNQFYCTVQHLTCKWKRNTQKKHRNKRTNERKEQKYRTKTKNQRTNLKWSAWIRSRKVNSWLHCDFNKKKKFAQF